MIKAESLVKSLEKDINSLEKKIKYTNIYNIRNQIVRLIIDSGIIIEKSMPFIVSCLIIFNANKYVLHKTPFKFDKVMKKNSIETIDTSNNIHIEKSSYDVKYNQEKIEFSTGWKLNENGYYQRIVTEYKINDSINLNNIDTILKMNNEEIQKILKVKNIKTYTKKTLTMEDNMFNENMIIITNHKTGNDEKLVDGIDGSNVFYTLLSCILCECFGIEINKLLKFNYFETKIGNLRLTEYKKITKQDLEKLKYILDIRKKNLELLKDSPKVIKKSGVKHE